MSNTTQKRLFVYEYDFSCDMFLLTTKVDILCCGCVYITGTRKRSQRPRLQAAFENRTTTPYNGHCRDANKAATK